MYNGEKGNQFHRKLWSSGIITRFQNHFNKCYVTWTFAGCVTQRTEYFLIRTAWKTGEIVATFAFPACVLWMRKKNKTMEIDPCGFMTTRLVRTSLFRKLVPLLKRSGTPIWGVWLIWDGRRILIPFLWIQCRTVWPIRMINFIPWNGVVTIVYWKL